MVQAKQRLWLLLRVSIPEQASDFLWVPGTLTIRWFVLKRQSQEEPETTLSSPSTQTSSPGHFVTLEGRVPVSPRRSLLCNPYSTECQCHRQELLSPKIWFPWSSGLLGCSESKLNPLGQTMTYISFQCVIFKKSLKRDRLFLWKLDILHGKQHKSNMLIVRKTH